MKLSGKNIYRIRQIVAGIVFILALAGVFGVFYGIKIFDVQVLPLVQKLVIDFSLITLLLFILLFVVTFIFGRIYCSLICPLGILQEIAGFIKDKIRKPRAEKRLNFPIKYFVAAVVWGIFAGGTVFLIRYLDPYSIFVSSASLAVLGLILLGVVLVAVILKDRIFCTDFCPVGAVLGLISKVSLFKINIDESACVSCGACEKNCPSGCIDFKSQTVDNEICVKCLKCLSVCPKSGIKYGITHKKTQFNPKRREFIIAAAALGLFAGMIKVGIEIKDKITEKIKDVILPAGAVSKERFLNSCLNCNLCVENCPNKIIKKADEEFGAVRIDYNEGFCKFDCNKCSEVCPSGAIKRISKEEKQKTRIAMAMINSDKCTKCGECSRVCPTHAIIIENGVPVLNASKCIGCGACKNSCFFHAIEIFGVREQKTI